MRTPWATKTGLAKTATIFATVLLVSLGLCGLNDVAMLNYVPGRHRWNQFLLIAAWTELAAIAVSVMSLLVIAGIEIYRTLRKPRADSRQE